MYAVKMRITDIRLWAENERIDIHLEQFRSREGREPTNEDLLAILHSTLCLPGVVQGSDDEFGIKALAESIVKNGVRRPPILDQNGDLLDGNRRVAACYYILHSSQYTPEQKRQAEYVYVWVLTEHADEDDREAVVVSLNFEDDCKLPWPEYVKARKVADQWEAMKLLEPRANEQRIRELKRELAKKFAIEVSTVNRYLTMVDWATDFEQYHSEERQRDLHEVRHRANHYFQYFKELSDGRKEGGVAFTLESDPDYKSLVFDLLFDGKFRRWEQIRILKHRDDDLDRDLGRVAAESNLAIAQRELESALGRAHERFLDKRRSIAADQRIESFVKDLRKLEVEKFYDPAGGISLENLAALLDLLDWLKPIVEQAMERRRSAPASSRPPEA